MNYFKQFINDILTEVSYRTNEGVVNLKNKDHISILSEVLDEMELTEIKNELIANLLEAGEQTLDPDQKEKAKKMGLVWKGQGWGKEDEEGIQFNQPSDFYFLRDDLVDADVVPEVGDIILYQEGYYGVQSTVANQYFGGKNPEYPNNINPLNPGLEYFGNNLSILVSTYYIPADKVAISPYQERM